MSRPNSRGNVVQRIPPPTVRYVTGRPDGLIARDTRATRPFTAWIITGCKRPDRRSDVRGTEGRLLVGGVNQDRPPSRVVVIFTRPSCRAYAIQIVEGFPTATEGTPCNVSSPWEPAFPSCTGAARLTGGHAFHERPAFDVSSMIASAVPCCLGANGSPSLRDG